MALPEAYDAIKIEQHLEERFRGQKIMPDQTIEQAGRIVQQCAAHVSGAERQIEAIFKPAIETNERMKQSVRRPTRSSA